MLSISVIVQIVQTSIGQDSMTRNTCFTELWFREENKRKKNIVLEGVKEKVKEGSLYTCFLGKK